LCIGLLSVVAGCKTTERVATPIADQHYRLEDSVHVEFHYDTTYIDRWHTIFAKGDTIYIKDSTYHRSAKVDAIHDTITTATTDTIHDIVTVEMQPTNKQVFFYKSGVAFWIILAAVTLAFIVYIILAFVKR